MILIVSDPKADAHIRPVTDELERRGADYAVYDPASYPNASTVTVEHTASGMRWRLAHLAFEDITAIWYRRPGDFELSPELSGGIKAWLQLECGHVFHALWESAPAFWISRPSAIRRASLKLLQLDIARRLGFSIPRFVVTNDADVARTFIDSCRKGAVVKVLTNPAVVDGERLGAVYTHLLSPEDMTQIEAVRLGPTFLQEFVPKRLDVRVTVIGDQVFAVGIESPFLAEGLVDFRRAEVYDLPHRVVTLPKQISAACRDLVRQLGLTFGAIDLLETPSGDYVFLEINPNGQWHWLEQITGVPLTAALCDMLIRDPVRHR